MPIERYKDVTIEGRAFRIGLVTASVGTWCCLQMASGKAGGEEVYEKIKSYLLSEVSVYREKDGQRIPMKVWDGTRWMDPAFEYDLELVYQVYNAALGHNFDIFFKKRAAEAEAERRAPALAISQSSSPQTSADTPGAQSSPDSGGSTN